MTRTRINLNRHWKFLLGDATGAEGAPFDDSTWQSIGLPHTFDLPYFRTPEFYVGIGWYRKRIEISEIKSSVRWLEFEGAFQVADIFLDGQPIGSHAGGYTGFSINLPVLTPGTHTLAIRISNEWNPQLVPRAGEHIFGGGLYRDVHLVTAPALHIPWNGIHITTPNVSRESATIHTATEIRNDSSTSRDCKLQHTVLDATGKRITTFSSSQQIPGHSSFTAEQTSEMIPDPALWHPDHPNLYTIQTRFLGNDESHDQLETKIGFRWFEWTPDRGFFLNGKHCYLRGANAHQDHAGWGIAITQAACWRDVQLLKEAGFNFVRGAHYPHHPAFADACDQLGLIFWSENCFWGKGGFGPEGYWNASAYPVNPQDRAPFAEHCKQTLREMIRINRNHPSIMVWSMTNEAFFTYNLDHARELMRDLVKLSKELDPTRPAAIGGAQRGNVDHLGDIAGYNGDGARLFINPGIPNMVSEYGAISKPHDAFDPFFGDLQQEQFPWRSGEAIWCAFDYGSIAGRQGLKGILHHNRLPKRSWHWYRQELRNIPAPPPPASGIPAKILLSANKATIHGTDATDDCQIIVSIADATGTPVSNSPPVKLTIESGPGEFPTGPSITFQEGTDIPITAGQAAIAFRSYHAGKTILRATSPGLKDGSLAITTTGQPAFIAGQTPPAIPRPYKPPQPSSAAVAAMKNIVDVARDRPSRASSEADSHPARFANDADPSSYWQARDNQPGGWLRIDLEGFYQLSGLRLAFPVAANYKYIVEISQDGASWSLPIDRRQTVRTDANRHDVFDPGSVARYVRLTFTHVPEGVPVGITSFEVHGILSVR